MVGMLGYERNVKPKPKPITNTGDRFIDLPATYTNGVDVEFQYEVRDSEGQTLERKKFDGMQLTDIRDSNGLAVERESFNTHEHIVMRPLAPHQSSEGRIFINRLFAITKPDRYEIQLGRDSGADSPMVMSNKLAFKIY